MIIKKNNSNNNDQITKIKMIGERAELGSGPSVEAEVDYGLQLSHSGLLGKIRPIVSG